MRAENRVLDRTPPAISIIIATYNRPDVLVFAIHSVLRQDFKDWELIVIGDHCTEATAAAVATFDDPRIRYINLDVNSGDQSGPNNAGIDWARGRYIAFLNQDDLWFPDHLTRAIDHLENTNADVIVGRSADVLPTQPFADQDWTVVLQGGASDGRFDPVTTTGPTSGLVLKTDVARAAGPWRSARECYSTSSQEWLFRMWYRGFAIQTVQDVTVLRFLSGMRPGSYVRSNLAEPAYFEPLLAAPAELRLLLLSRVLQTPILRRLRRAISNPCLRAAALLGWAPSELIGRFVLRYRRGQLIQVLRETRGLPRN